jgi:hypothetical protein
MLLHYSCFQSYHSLAEHGLLVSVRSAFRTHEDLRRTIVISPPHERFRVVNGKPVVRGPAYTAGASATKTESFLPSDGHMPRESEMKASPLPWECPMKAI